MSILKVTVAALLLATTVAGCASPRAIATSHSLVTEDKSHWAVQIMMKPEGSRAKAQEIMIVYNKWSKTPIAFINSEVLPLSDTLMVALIGAVGNLGASAVGGHFQLLSAQANCPPGTLCGTLVQVNNQAGATAGAEADASSN